jgi:5-methylcytosine-specific restriction endonuclease McrA
VLTIVWRDEESAGYADLIPYDWLRSEGYTEERTHDVIGPRLGRDRAKCSIGVSGINADLDYRPFAEFNHKHGMLLGVLRVQFSTTDRSAVSRVLWKDEGRRVFKPYPTTVTLAPVSQEEFDAEVAASLRLSSAERRKRLASAPRKPKRMSQTSTAYHRNPDVVAEVLPVAKGVCQLCKSPAPFKRASTGKPYLEVHHRIWLARGGDDTVENAIALCPNCHRKAHYG